MRNLQNDPLLLTPGPLTTSESVKKVMVQDWGSRDPEFIAMTARVRIGVEDIAGVADGSHVCVLLQGSGTFAVEAAITSLIPRDGRVLVLVNGAYGHRIRRVCDYHGRKYFSMETDENVPPDVAELAAFLASNADITHVIAVHCETTSGILNPIAEIAKVVQNHECHLIIDAMSSFGALTLSVQDVPCLAIVASSNKCLEGAPGIGFVVAEREALQKAKGNANSLALDIHAQWVGFESNGQWRFPPPTQVLAALRRHTHGQRIARAEMNLVIDIRAKGELLCLALAADGKRGDDKGRVLNLDTAPLDRCHQPVAAICLSPQHR